MLWCSSTFQVLVVWCRSYCRMVCYCVVYMVWRCIDCTTVVCTRSSTHITQCYVLLCVQEQSVELYAIKYTDVFFGTNTSARCTFPQGLQSYGVMVFPFVEPYLWIFAGSVASRNSLFSEPHLLSSPTAHWMCYSLEPLPLLLLLSSKHNKWETRHHSLHASW